MYALKELSLYNDNWIFLWGHAIVRGPLPTAWLIVRGLASSICAIVRDLYSFDWPTTVKDPPIPSLDIMRDLVIAIQKEGLSRVICWGRFAMHNSIYWTCQQKNRVRISQVSYCIVTCYHIHTSFYITLTSHTSIRQTPLLVSRFGRIEKNWSLRDIELWGIVPLWSII